MKTPAIHESRDCPVFDEIFQKISAEAALNMKIVVQTAPIIEPAGVQEGRLMLLYQFIPPLVSRLPIPAVKIAIRGIMM